MNPEFWSQRWATGQIGFHEGKPNALLGRATFQLNGIRRMLVPLCGKAFDLKFLAERGIEVVGVELVEDAVRAFFEEHRMKTTVTEVGAFKKYSGHFIDIWCGDFFATTRELLGALDGFYDRAALIALPSEMRPRYVAHLRSLLARRARGIQITLEYAQAEMQGPPFAVMEEEVRALYAGTKVTLLERAEGRTRQEGLVAHDALYRIEIS